ncbi:MAG: NnrU family protein [Woeseiaceae bacterium]
MTVLIAGILLWTAAHLVPGAAPGVRQDIVARIGEKPWKGLFALVVAGSLVLVVLGWRSTAPQALYLPPDWGRSAAIALMLISVFLFGAARRPSAIKRIVRHPQLTGLIVWSVAHLLANGDQRSLILFGGLGVWAILEIIVINRRDGAWTKPQAPSVTREAIGVAVTVVVFAALLWAHPYFTGVPVIVR